MKKEDTHIDDIELQVTNIIEEPVAETTASQKDKDTPDNQEKHAQGLPPSLEELATEEDGPVTDGLTLLKVLGGEFFNAQFLRRQLWLILLIAVFVVFYISNRYSCQKSMVEINRLNKELRDAKYKALSTSSELTERSRESRVLETLKEVGDSTLQIASEPPYLININKETNE